MSNLRKQFLAVAAFSTVLTSAFVHGATADERSLSFDNTHTGEKISLTYWRNGEYDQTALKSVSNFLRDRLNGDKQEIDPLLLDRLHLIKTELEAQKPGLKTVFEVISGFRSEETNEALRKNGARIAKKSQHMQGRAMDIRVNGVPLETLRDTAWCQKKGGVGYYPEPHNNFIHVDTGRTRFWPEQKTKWKCMD